VGSSLTYRIVLSGTGNFNQTQKPFLPEIRGIRFMPPETEDTKTSTENYFSGKRIWIYPVILQEIGTIVIPENSISWYDPTQKKFITEKLKSFTINVLPSTQNVITTPGAQHTTRPTGLDIAYIISKIPTKNYNFLYQKAWFGLLILFLFLSIFVHYFYILEMKKQKHDMLYYRNKRATSVIKKYLKEAQNYAKYKSTEFYDSAFIGLSKFITDKLNLPRGSQEKIMIENLHEKNVDIVLIERIEDFYKKLNLAKFSRANVSENDIEKDFEILEKIIEGLNFELNKKKIKGKK
jgi:hypothetical protein